MESLNADQDDMAASETKDLQEKMKKVDVNPTVSPTSILIRNTALLPSGVARMKQSQNIGGVRASAFAVASSSGSATGNPRNKTALAPGHSLMDWIRLGSSGIDLTGVGGVTQVVTPNELAKHNKQNDAWIAIRGKVYNVSRYMDFHPGGVLELMKGVGKDATKLFNDVHGWVNYESILQKCEIGRLSRSSITSDRTIANVISNPTISSNLLSSCTRKNIEKEADSALSSVKFNWKHTTHSVTFSYITFPDHLAVSYRLLKINDAKYHLDIVFDKNTITHEIDLLGDIKWPPNWKRNFETTQVDFNLPKVIPKIWKSYGTHTATNSPTSKDRLYREFEVISNTSLCPVVHLIMLRPTNYVEIIPIGRHVEAKMTVMGMDVSRMYTPVPPCLHCDDMVPNYTPNCICLMVKRYSDGALSPSMTALEPGQTLSLSNSLGTFTVESFDDYPIVHMLAAGTGLTVMLGIIHRALGRRTIISLNLICFNKDEENIFYAAQLNKVCDTGKFKINHVLSQGRESWSGMRGTVSDKLLSELVGRRNIQGCVMICGPKGFMEVAKKSVKNLGWKPSQIHEFDD